MLVLAILVHGAICLPPLPAGHEELSNTLLAALPKLLPSIRTSNVVASSWEERAEEQGAGAEVLALLQRMRACVCLLDAHPL